MIDGSKRVNSGKDVPFGGFRFRQKNFTLPLILSPNSKNFALPFCITYKYWRKRRQNSYSNRKQPIW